MRNRLILRFVLVALLLAGGVFILHSNTPVKVSEPTCGQKKANGGCSQAEPGGMLWENVSRQFISAVIVQP